MNGISALVRVMRELHAPFCSPLCKGTRSWPPGKEFLLSLTVLVPCLRRPASRTMRNTVLLLISHQSMVFVVAA